MGTISNLDEAAIRIITVFDRDDVQSLRIDNENLRAKLRQFKQVDAKKSQELKAKNDDISALQKELSNTKHRFYEQKTDRVHEITDMKEKLDQKTDDLERLLLEKTKNDRIDQNYLRQIVINKKEINFLRDELSSSRQRIADLDDRVVQEQELKHKEDVTDKIRRQAEIEKSHGEQWRFEVKKVKVIEKELDQLKLENKELGRQAKDKSVAIEKEKLWRATVARLQPKCDLLEEENERLQGDVLCGGEKIKRLENELNEMRMSALQLANEIGSIKASLAVERSRVSASQNTISELRKELDTKTTDISLTQSARQGDVDISALRDQIKKLKDENERLSSQIQRYRALGNHDSSKEAVLSYRFNPTNNRYKKRARSDISPDTNSPESAETNSDIARELTEMREKLFYEQKSKAKVIEVVKTRIDALREAIASILGYQVTTNDYQTFKFLSTFAQKRDDYIQFQKHDDDGQVSFQLFGSPLFDSPDLEHLVHELTNDENVPNMMSKTTLALSSQQTLMI